MSIVTSRATRSLFPRLGDARLQVVAPGVPAGLPHTFSRVDSDARRYEETIDRIQQFRDRVYRDDGAIPENNFTEEHNHYSDLDRRCWHLLVTGSDGGILACIRYIHFPERPIPLDAFHLMRIVERGEPGTARKLREALRAFLDQANQRGLGLSEIGGWAAGPEVRTSVKALLLACACWSLAELLADPFALAAATTRHHSVEILRRLGGFGLDCNGAESAWFFDTFHGCEMQIMGFSLLSLAPPYRPTVDDITRYLRKTPVLVR